MRESGAKKPELYVHDLILFTRLLGLSHKCQSSIPGFRGQREANPWPIARGSDEVDAGCFKDGFQFL
jgi:hypothetical protein